MQVLHDTLLFLWIILVQAYWGNYAVRAVGTSAAALPLSTKVWLAFVFSNAGVSALVCFLGYLHIVTPLVLVSILSLASAPLIFQMFPILRRIRSIGYPPLSANSKLLLLLIVCISAVALGGSLAPEVRGDAIIYHISEAMLFSVNRGHVEIPGSVLTYIPQYQQLIYAAALTLGGDTLAKLFHWWAGMLLIGGTYSIARLMRISREGAIAAGALIALVPVWTYLGTSCYVDLATANYTLAAVSFAVVAVSGRSVNAWRLAIYSGVMLGFAMGTKYTAIVNAAVPLALAWTFALVRQRVPFRVIIRTMTLLTVSSLIAFAPWLLRNYAWTGNPVAPSLMQWLGPAGVPDSTLNWGDIRAGDPDLVRSPLKLLAAFPAMIFAFSDYGNYLPTIVLLMLALLLISRRGKGLHFSPVIYMLCLFLLATLLLGVPTMAVRRDSRYVMAHMAIVATLLVLAADQVFNRTNLPVKRQRVFTTLLFVILTAFYITRTITMFRDLNESLLPPFRQAARDEYQRKRLKDYDSNKSLTKSGLSADNKVYGAWYPARVHYVMTGAPITSDLLLPTVEQLQPSDLEKLRRHHVGYIFGNVPQQLTSDLQRVGEYGGKPLYRLP